MALSVIGAGLGRTGTMSLKLALEQLGFGRCYHMIEVFPDPKAPRRWLDALDGTLGDWEEIFAGYGATTDLPGCIFYRELAEVYPQAKLILTVRDPDRWFDSTQATIFADDTSGRIGDPTTIEMMEKLAFGMFDGRIHEREHCIAAFRRHNAEVIETIPPERLLIYDVAEGWGPLCGFLGAPIPDTPFPKANTTAEFGDRHLPDAITQMGG